MDAQIQTEITFNGDNTQRRTRVLIPGRVLCEKTKTDNWTSYANITLPEDIVLWAKKKRNTGKITLCMGTINQPSTYKEITHFDEAQKEKSFERLKNGYLAAKLYVLASAQ